MSTEILKKVRVLYRYMSINGLLDALLLIAAAISANFLTYIYYFDINALALIDSSTVAKHVLILSLNYVGALAVVTIVLVLYQHTFLQLELAKVVGKLADFQLNMGPDLFRRSSRVLLWKLFEERTLRLLFTVLFFSFFYIGRINSLLLCLVSAIFFPLMVFLYLKFIGEEDYGEKIITMNILGNKINTSVPTFNSSDDIKQTSIHYLLTKVGFVAIYLALAIGIGRADFVKNNVRVSFANEAQEVTIIASSSAGMIFYDVEKSFVFFKSWEALGNLSLPSESQRSIKTIFQ